MKCLIVEDSFVARKLLKTYLSSWADCDIAVDGNEAVVAFRQALDEKEPYDLICLDIMMPNMDGRHALKLIRQIESEHAISGLDCVKVIMTTALDDPKNVIGSFREGCEAYIVKPVKKDKLLQEIQNLGLLNTVGK
ncbi:MAG: response regulator [Planctomycetes bacterium]|nr:response regulator [Planctomycetota bacterium]